MADVITRLKVDSQEYDAKIKRATQSLNEMTTAAEREGNKIATANKENIALAQSLGKMATVSTTAKGKMGELTSAIEAATIQYNRLTAAERQGRFGKALNASIGQLQTRLAGLKTEMAAVQTQMGKTSGMGIGAQLGQGFKSGMMMFGPQMAAMAGVMAAAAGVKKVFSDMVNINKEFEQKTANLASVIGLTTDQMSGLTAQAKQLGATTRYTANEITELQTNLARLGFTQQEILNSTTAVQAFATATGADLGEAANLAGAALRGFGLNATEMERVASVMAVSTTKSALSFEKLATAVPIVAPVAKQFGFTIEDTITLLGKLSDAGMDASMAATATRNIFLKMANDSGKLAQAMGRPVHSVEEFGEALKEMREKGMSLNDILSMVGVRSTAAFAVFADNAETLKDFKASITDVSDEMHEMESKQLNTLQGSIILLNSAWEGLMLTFSESNGTIRKVVDSLTALLQAYTNWRKRRQGGDEAITTFELGEDPAKTKEYIESKRAEGMTDAQIKSAAEADKAALEAERDAAKALYDQLAEIGKLKGKEHDAKQGEWNKQFDAMFKNDKYNYNVRTDGAASAYLMRQIASMNDQAATMGAVVGQFTPSSAATPAGGEGGEGGAEAASKKQLQILKAQYEEQEKAQIAALDRMAMNEADYEAEVYRIKRETLQKIADLYQDETAEKARANAALSQLDIQYQGTQMRLANKANRPTKATTEEYTGVGEFSQKAVGARMSHAKKAMNEAEIGSGRYLYEADKIVDLTTFQNLLKAATEAGMDIDPSIIEESLGQIDMGLGVSDEAWQKMVDSINAKLAELDLPPIELDVKTGNVKALDNQIGSLEQNLEGAINVFGQLGQAMQEIDDPGAKVAGIIMGAIANIAGTFAASLKGTFTPWDWIAAAISGTATMISTIAAIKSATSGAKGYASGGMVGGNSYSGDNIVARLNSGEGVLTAKGVQNAAAMASNTNPMQNLQLFTEVSGTNLRIVLNNDNRSKGGSRGYYANIH